MSKYERETCILFNEADDFATVFTYKKSWQHYFEKLGNKPYRQDNGGREYRFPKSWIKFPAAPRKRRATSSNVPQGTLFPLEENSGYN